MQQPINRQAAKNAKKIFHHEGNKSEIRNPKQIQNPNSKIQNKFSAFLCVLCGKKFFVSDLRDIASSSRLRGSASHPAACDYNPPMQPQPAIELQNVGLLIGGRWILRDVNWSLMPGQLGVILGPNGSGKSTLARILAAHSWPSDGTVTLLGRRFGETSLPDLRHSIRLVQTTGPYEVSGELSTRQVVETGFFASINLYDRPTPAMRKQTDDALEMVGLTDVLDHPYRTLSNGERVRCLIARALVRRPGILVLDEPTAGLDLLAREQILATIDSLLDQPHAPAIVLITHHIEELGPKVNNVLLMDHGQVAATGAPNEVLREEILSKVYRCPLQIRRSNGRHYVQVHPQAWTGLLSRSTRWGKNDEV
jgi:iron complex transport system ATP-binding protein